MMRILNCSVAMRLLAVALVLNLGACATPRPHPAYIVSVSPDEKYPKLEIAPLPLNAALVMPESVTSAIEKKKIEYKNESTEVTVPVGKALERGAVATFSQAFNSLELITDKDRAVGQYDVLIQLTSSELKMDGSEGRGWRSRMMGWKCNSSSWVVNPLPYITLPLWVVDCGILGSHPYSFYVGAEFSITAMITDNSGKTLAKEEARYKTWYYDDYRSDDAIQDALEGALSGVTKRLVTAPRLLQYAKSLPGTPEERMARRQKGEAAMAALEAPLLTIPTDEKLPPSRKDAHPIIIGIDYQNRQDIPHLQYASSDAKKVYEILTDPRYGGIPKENATLLLNEKATRIEIMKVIRKIKKPRWICISLLLRPWCAKDKRGQV